jgi:hypothetical protein
MAYPTNVDAKIALLEAQLEADLANGLNSSVIEILEKLKNIRLVGSGGGGGGASASDIGNAVNGTPINGQSLEAGGTGNTGWLASIRKAITDRLPASLGAKTGAGSISVVPASDGFPVTNTGVGLPADSAATSNTGTFGLVAFIKRYLASVNAPKTSVRVLFSTSGDNPIINAPSAGQRIVITAMRVQNLTDVATTVLIKNGASTTMSGIRTTVDGTGFDDDYSYGNEIRLSDATALIMNLSAANAHSTSIRYYLETVATGLPA